MRVMEVKDLVARCDAHGVQREVSLFMMQHESVRPGDFVVVHVGYAIQKLSAEEYRTSWELFDQILTETPVRDTPPDA